MFSVRSFAFSLAMRKKDSAAPPSPEDTGEQYAKGFVERIIRNSKRKAIILTPGC